MVMKKKATAKPAPAGKRSYLKQSDVPAASLDEALRVPEAIYNNYGGVSATPLQVAKALNMDPGGSQIKVLPALQSHLGWSTVALKPRQSQPPISQRES